ncbi:MAG: hypothetical protein J3Q66DRAFT_393092 [Benniella sp.]|nr:MAG: hypothetical protein J3Q66DRAFT_393092 [Benniella sp.]
MNPCRSLFLSFTFTPLLLAPFRLAVNDHTYYFFSFRHLSPWATINSAINISSSRFLLSSVPSSSCPRPKKEIVPAALILAYEPQPRPQSALVSLSSSYKTAALSPLPPLPSATAVVESGSVGVKIGMFSCSLKTSEGKSTTGYLSQHSINTVFATNLTTAIINRSTVQPKVHHQRRLRIIVAVDYYKAFRLASTAAVMRHIEGAEKPPSSVTELSLSTNYEMAAWSLIVPRPGIRTSPSNCLLGTRTKPALAS